MNTRFFVTSLMLTLAAPASAQIWDGGGGGISPQPHQPSHTSPSLDRLDTDIRQARRSGQIDKRQERALRRESARIAAVTDRYRTGGISDSERAEIESRTLILKGLVDARRSTGAPR